MLSTCTEHELAVIKNIKERLENDNSDVDSKIEEYRRNLSDCTVLRFYRGRKSDEEKTMRALQHHFKWRDENSVDFIESKVDEFERELKANKVIVGDKVDKNGRPVVYIFAAKHNKNDRDLIEIKKMIIFTLEQVIKRAKPDDERMIICFDLSSFSYTCMDYEVVQLLINILQFNYPETLESALIVDSPFLFYACWAVIRPWLDPVTAAKVQFVSRDHLSTYFEDASIPDEMAKVGH